MKILEALQTMNHEDDAQWTGDGLPALAVVRELVGEKVTRKQVTEADPNFSRATLEAAHKSVDAEGGDHQEAEENQEAEPSDESGEPVETEAERLARLEEQKAELESRRDEVREFIVEAQAEENRLVAELDEVLIEITNEDPNEPAHIRETKKRMEDIRRGIERKQQSGQRSALDRSLLARGGKPRGLMGGGS